MESWNYVKKLVKITIFEHQQNGDPKWSFFFSRHKQGRAPEAYERERRRALNRAEQERKQGKSAPDYLEGVKPPWDDERQEILNLYDEMMVQDFEESIAGIESASATMRAMEEAESARKSKGGPGGQGRR